MSKLFRGVIKDLWYQLFTAWITGVRKKQTPEAVATGVVFDLVKMGGERPDLIGQSVREEEAPADVCISLRGVRWTQYRNV